MNNSDNLITISWKICIVQFEVEHFSAKGAFQFLPQKPSIFDSVTQSNRITLAVNADCSDANGNQRGSFFP